jgi:hypothetical protein
VEFGPFESELARWQGKIAAAAREGNGLDIFQAALNWAKHNVPSDNGLCELAKREISEAAERHLFQIHGPDIFRCYLSCYLPRRCDEQ